MHVVFTCKIAASKVLYGFKHENLFRIIRNNFFEFERLRDLRGCALNRVGQSLIKMLSIYNPSANVAALNAVSKCVASRVVIDVCAYIFASSYCLDL